MNDDEIVLKALDALMRRAHYTFDNFIHCGVVEGFKRERMLAIRGPLGFLAWENVGVTVVSMYGVLEG